MSPEGRQAPRIGARAAWALLVAAWAAGPVEAHAAPTGSSAHALAARTADPVGWWKGRVWVVQDVRAGGLSAAAGRLSALAAAGVGGLVVAPLAQDARGALEDHRRLDARAGTEAELGAFVAAAHQAGLAVVLSLPLAPVAATHPWFVAAEAGDRLAQDSFVWRDARPEDGDTWGESARGGRWYRRTPGTGTPELELRHRPTAARVRQAVEGWVERGLDGVLLTDVRRGFADDAGAGDRPELVGWLRELGGALGERGALLAVHVDDQGLGYTAAAPLVWDEALSRALSSSPVGRAVVEQLERGAPLGRAVGAPLSGATATPSVAARALAVTSAVLLPEALAEAPAVRELLALRGAHPALAVGLRLPVEGAPWLSWRQDLAARVLVAIGDRDTPQPLVVDAGGEPLAPLLGAVPLSPKGARLTGTLPPGAVAAWAAPARLGALYGFGRPGMTPARGVALDRGLALGPVRAAGASTDVEATLVCARGRGRDAPVVRCGAPLLPVGREPFRWHLRVPPGPYEVEVEADTAQPVRVEGQVLARPRGKKTLAGAVFVRDGRLTLEASDPDGVLWSLRVVPAKVAASTAEVEVRADRVVLRARTPGVVEWRMNGSQAEPAESAPLVASQGAWTATLGPWPKGAVREVAWVIRSPEGGFVTAPGGAELMIAIP